MDVNELLSHLDQIESAGRDRKGKVYYTTFGMRHGDPGYYVVDPDAEEWAAMSLKMHAEQIAPAEMPDSHEPAPHPGGGSHRMTVGAPDEAERPVYAGLPRIVRV